MSNLSVNDCQVREAGRRHALGTGRSNAQARCRTSAHPPSPRRGARVEGADERAGHESPPACIADERSGRGRARRARCAAARLPAATSTVRRPREVARRGSELLGHAARRVQGARRAGAVVSVVRTVEVTLDPLRAFEAFTGEIGEWYVGGPHSWNDPQRAVGIRFEPGVGGRWIEVWDEVTGEGY